MDNLIILLCSLFATGTTIRVPTWNAVYYKDNRSNQPRSFHELDILLTPTNNRWSPITSTPIINTLNYKKPPPKQIYRKNNIYDKPIHYISTKIDNFAQAQPQINNYFDPFDNVAPIKQNFQPQVYTFDNNRFFQFPTTTTKPQFDQIPRKRTNVDNFNDFKPLEELKQVNINNKPQYVSHLDKNYRDDKTHEPNRYDPHYKNEDVTEIEREEDENAPTSSHEFPADIPTKPIYPGQGLWAKPGIKHKPFVSKQKYDELEEDKVKPDGFETFENGQKLFDKQNKEFTRNLKLFPKQQEFSENNDEVNEDNDESDEENEFVPTKLYAQVREIENTEYLPEDEDDGRLREAIKEAKTHTVYTEEGYEDSAYDHAGHEKEAANDEGFEDIEREKIENRPANRKYNLHSPRITTAKFSIGNGVLSDEEIEKLKEEKLNIEDTDTAGSQFEEITTREPIKENKNFISTKETKTTMTKEKDNGNTETEFSGRIDTVLKPNNGTHKYEKVYPKVYKTIQKSKTENIPKTVDFSGIFIEEIISSTPTPPTEDLPEEIPITTLPTTAIPKPNQDNDLEVFDGFLHSKQRVKRYANDFSNLGLNSEFVPSINHELGEVKKDDTNNIKFPYYDKYKEKGLNENSPLRYAENLQNIPKKTGENMIFYEEAERKVKCPEVRETVDAIPERVLKAENDDEDEEDDDDDEENIPKPKKLAEQPKTPRLTGLGDQIDCLKIRYFGENPLDSPIFKEDSIQPPVPIFDILKRRNEKNGNKQRNIDKVSIKNDINDDNIETNKLLTTPTYTPTLKPKHTHRQTELQDFLPEETNIEKGTIIYEQFVSAIPNSAIRDVDKGREKQISRQSKSVPDENEDQKEILPQAEELRRRKIKRKRPPFQIFDINKFLPTTPFPIFNEKIPTNTELKSEVSYKDEIKPNEQLYVLTDILNNIKNSSQQQSPDDAAIQSSESVYFNLNPKLSLYYPDTYLQAYENDNYRPQIGTTTLIPATFKRKTKKQPVRPTVDPAVVKEREEKLKLYLSLLEAKKRQKNSTTPDYGITIPVTENINDYIDKTTEVMGLMPPSTRRYKTISHPKRDNSLQISNSIIKKMNKYFVIGLKPPPKQKVTSYSDFIKNKRMSVRIKRSTSTYATLSRNKEEEEEEKKSKVVDNEEDEKPHRSKSYYYDEKTGRIVYITTEKPESQEEEEEEYEEITEQPSSTLKPLQDPVFVTATPPPEGKSYVDFVNKLHDESGYKNIPDPTTTETNEEINTISTTTNIIAKAESTTPPPFLNILNKIRQNSDYKIIEDIKTTTENYEEIVNEEENIKNSPGGSINEHYEQLGIFDVSDFIPKLKNYLPKTSYDTSKYKTISRPTSKPIKEDEADSTTQKEFLIITEETDNVKEPSIIKENEGITIQRRRMKTTTTTTPIPSSTEPVANKLRRRRPIIHLHSDEDEKNATKIVKRRSDNTGTNETKNVVENYSRNKKGNNRNTEKSCNNATVEIIADYDTDKKHGGNYRSIEEAPSENKVADNEEIANRSDKLILSKENEETTTMKMNLPKEFTKIEDDLIPNSRKQSSRGNKHKQVNETTPTRLTDIVPKPESFYKDPNLSKSVNTLESYSKPTNEEIEGNEEPEKMLKFAFKNKPNIVKDPSKRLYYYAPI
ncbi:uncharacterized protein LOC130442928 [Diorhabda sublineata]|uniref:uncharacterized protein LOC130442928 n=1 Tax=Diorhabda sublineata TaxID=1163346 RepID=UPI0024E0F43A|nr:uncharacterized protein LOC130442928 [Diorhabda sublineata]